MRLTCPHCRLTVELVPDGASGDSVSCPSCGSLFHDLQETVTYRRTELKSSERFELIEHVGRGHFGDVWKARDQRLRRIIALKLPRTQDFDEETTRAFMREARAAAKLEHPNIVTVFDVGRDGDTVFIASQFVSGVTLADLIAKQRMSAHKAAELCSTVADALDHAHAAGVVHRDLKPRNIMIDLEDRPHVMDFGLAKQEAGEISVTMTGEVLGTPAYMPPEQAEGHSRDADARSDVYSLGVVLYELLTGKRPFSGSSRMLIRQILVDDPEPPRKHDKNIPRDLETICLKAMAKEPNRRYQSAREMAEDLGRYLGGEPIHARRATPFERGWRWMRRKPALAAASALGVAASILLVAVAAIWWRNTQLEQLARADLKIVVLDTKPPGAKIVFYPLHPVTFEPQPEDAIRPPTPSPVRVELPAGDYLVVAVSSEPGYSFHEVLRRVPPGDTWVDDVYLHLNSRIRPDGVVELPTITIPTSDVTDGMTRFGGGSAFEMGSSRVTGAHTHERVLPAFLLDTGEITIGQFRSVLKTLPGTYSDQNPSDADPVAFVSWDEAVKYAEKVGKRLPKESEFEFAATLGSTRDFPWGDDAEQMVEWTVPKSSRADVLPTQPPVMGLFSGLAEWTGSGATLYPAYRRQGMTEPEDWRVQRIVRGGPNSVIDGEPDIEEWKDGPRIRMALFKETRKVGLGFRCARSVRPRLHPEDFERIVQAGQPVASRSK